MTHKPIIYLGLICLIGAACLIYVIASKHVVGRKSIGEIVNGRLEIKFVSPDAYRFFILAQPNSKELLNGTIQILVDILTWRHTSAPSLESVLQVGSTYDFVVKFSQMPPTGSSLWFHWLE